VLPLSRVGAADQCDFAMDDIKFMTGLNIEPVVVSGSGVAGNISSLRPLARDQLAG
jgi:hypothetical protein